MTTYLNIIKLISQHASVATSIIDIVRTIRTDRKEKQGSVFTYVCVIIEILLLISPYIAENYLQMEQYHQLLEFINEHLPLLQFLIELVRLWKDRHTKNKG